MSSLTDAMSEGFWKFPLHSTGRRRYPLFLYPLVLGGDGLNGTLFQPVEVEQDGLIPVQLYQSEFPSVRLAGVRVG